MNPLPSTPPPKMTAMMALHALNCGIVEKPVEGG